MTQLSVSEIPSPWFVRDEIRKKVKSLVELPFDAFTITKAEGEGLPFNWDVQFNAAWTGANTEVFHRHAQAVEECAAEVRQNWPVVEFDE